MILASVIPEVCLGPWNLKWITWRDLAPFRDSSSSVCWDLLWSVCIPNLKCLWLPAMKIRKATQNATSAASERNWRLSTHADLRPLAMRRMGANLLFWCPQSYLQNRWNDRCQIFYACRILSHASLEMTDWLPVGVVMVTWPVFLEFRPIISFELVKLGTSNVVCWLIQRCTSALVID